ncbi:MAG: Rrf2 family transcriptional regulator [Coriobacteriales bacterium]|nr:Rrf2 family transcriptional regulator [Coriobacteriales bacterium]
MRDTRLSSALHLLVLVSEAQKPMSSEQMAMSMGTNASYVRRLSGSLRKAGIVQSRKGSPGLRLVPDPAKLTLLDIYLAACETDHVELFEVHHNPSDRCIVGRHISPVLGGMFKKLEEEAAHELRSLTLADCIAALRAHAAQANDSEGVA